MGNEQKTLTLGSLFDGSGTFPLGGLMAGIQPVWSSDVEPFPIRVTTKRMPFIKHYGDIGQMNGGEIEPVDIITFGSPCTSLSIAGLRAGLHGKQSVLFFEAVRIIKEMRCATDGRYPRFIVWENVTGAFSSSKGRDFQSVLTEIVRIKEPQAPEVPMPEKNWPSADILMGDGWSLAYRVFDSQGWGVPQRRRRIYLVADFGGGCAPKVLFDTESVLGDSPACFRSWQGTADSLASRIGAAGGVMSAGFCTEHSAKSRSIGYEVEKSPTLRAGVVPAAVTNAERIVLADQGGQRIDVLKNVMPTLRAEAHHPPLVFESHAQDARYNGPLKVAPTISQTYGAGGNNQPLVTKYWDGGDVAGTLTANNAGGNQRMPDKDNFHGILQPFGISSHNSNAMRSDNPKSGIYEATTSRTLDQKGGDPACQQGGVAIVSTVDVRFTSEGTKNARQNVYETNTARTLDTGGNAPESNQGGIAVVAIQGSMIGRKDENGPQGSGINENVSFTLNATDRHAVFAMTTGGYTQVEKEKAPTLMSRDYKDPAAVCCGIGRDVFNAGANAKFAPSIDEELQPPMTARGPGAVQQGYAVRRLTPTECARLQGFPDWWCSDLGTENPTAEEMEFWRDVFETHRKVMGTGKKPKTDNQIRKWLKNPHTDSAEYRMWGNGCSVPIVFYVLFGIAHFAKEVEPCEPTKN